MRIGVVSDLHGSLPEWAARELERCDGAICAGDVERESVVWELEAIGLRAIVAGNCDHAPAFLRLPRIARLAPEGVPTLVVHRPQDIPWPPEAALVIHGHTHIPRDETIDGVRYVNPGSPVRPRGGSEPSIAVISLSDGKVESVRFVREP